MNTTLISIIVFLLLFAIMRMVSSLLWKILGMLLVLLAAALIMYTLAIGPFEKNPLDTAQMKEKYCEKSASEPHICDCIVHPLEKDLEKRFTEEERKELHQNRLEWAYVVNKSLDAIKPESLSCLKIREAEDEWQAFINELLMLDNQWLKKARNFAVEQKEKVMEQAGKQEKTIDNIDRKYAE
jgi:hypothetical protein